MLGDQWPADRLSFDLPPTQATSTGHIFRATPFDVGRERSVVA
jgi:hypothetical protein